MDAFIDDIPLFLGFYFVRVRLGYGKCFYKVRYFLAFKLVVDLYPLARIVETIGVPNGS